MCGDLAEGETSKATPVSLFLACESFTRHLMSIYCTAENRPAYVLVEVTVEGQVLQISNGSLVVTIVKKMQCSDNMG